MVTENLSTESMNREELAQLQLERLQASIFRAYRSVSFYRRRFDELGITPEDIQSVDDLRKLPFTTKEDLRSGYPYDMLAVPLREVVRLHNSSWHTGHPTVCAFTRHDLQHWHDMVAGMLSAAGVTRDDVVQIFFGMQKVTSGLGFHGGAEHIGASVIPAAQGDMDQQLAIMQDFKSTVIIGAPSGAAELVARLRERNLDVRRLSTRVGLFGSEPWSETLRGQIEDALDIIALDYYALGEVGGPGVAAECVCKCGLHLAEDQFIAEVVDPETGEPAPDGQQGELVLTTLTREALPLLRYRTRDLTSINTEPCACGRRTARIARIARRTDGLLFVRGISFHPATVEAALAEIEGAEPHFQIILDRVNGIEEAELLVEVSPAMNADSLGHLLTVEQRIIEAVRRATGLTIKVRLVEPLTFSKLARGESSRCIDKRS